MGASGYWMAIGIGLTLSGIAVTIMALYVSRTVERGLKLRIR